MQDLRAIDRNELVRLLEQNIGWLVLHIGTPLHSEHDRSARSFEETAERLQLHWSTARLARCELSPVEAAQLAAGPCPILRGAAPAILVFVGTDLVERIAGGGSADDLIAFVDFTVSYHTTWAPQR